MKNKEFLMAASNDDINDIAKVSAKLGQLKEMIDDTLIKGEEISFKTLKLILNNTSNILETSTQILDDQVYNLHYYMKRLET